MRIHDLRRQRAALVTEMKAIAAKEAELPLDEALPAEDSDRFTAIESEIAVLDGRISKLEAAQAADVETAKSEDEGDDEDTDSEKKNFKPMTFKSFTAPAAAVQPVEKGIRAARFVLGAYHAKQFGARAAARMVAEKFGDEVVAKALAATSGDGTSLIPQAFSTDLIELLRARVAVRKMNPTMIGLDAGNISLPRLAGGATAAYGAELSEMPVSQEAFDQVHLTAKKLTALVPVSNSLLRRSPIGLDGVVRDDLVQSMARVEDIAFLRGVGSATTPTGLTKQTGIQTMAVANGELETVIKALRGMVVRLENANVRMINVGWIMNPTTKAFLATLKDGVGNFYFKNELDAGMLLGFPVVTTTSLPANLGTGSDSEVIIADFADVIIGDTFTIAVDASDSAAYNDGTAVKSVFQTDSTLFRAVSEHDIGLRHPQSVVVATVTGWTLV